MDSPSKRNSSGAGLTPRAVPRGVAGTPVGRAKSAEPPSTRRSIHTPGTGHGRTPGTQQRPGLSTSARKALGATATPHARAVFRTLDSRRAIFTPGKNRRKSVRDQRETPRDVLRNLSKRLAASSQPIPPSSSPRDRKTGSDIGPILEDDEDDDIPIDRPRLSLPIDVDDDDSDLHPHRSAGLEDQDLTIKSVELPRRALSEQPRRYSRSSLGSIRMSDYIDGNDISDEFGHESTFFPQGAFDAAFEDIGDDQPAEDVTYERLDSELGRRDAMGAGRESDFGVIDAPLDVNESTFLLAPQVQSSPERTALQFDHDEAEDGPMDDGVAGDSSDLEDLDVETTTKIAAHRGKRKKRGVKVSRHGIQYPSLPTAVVKRLAQTFAQTSGVSKAKISPETLSAISQASDWFFEQLGDDLQAYAKHAGRKTIDESDMLTLMKRQRQTSTLTTPFSLAQRHLPRELLQDMRMTPPATSHKRRRKSNAGEEPT